MLKLEKVLGMQNVFLESNINLVGQERMCSSA